MILDSSKERCVEFDLVWLFCHSEGDCGIKSNYSSMVNCAIYGASTTYVDPYNSFLLNSVDHKRELEKIFYSLSHQCQKVLYASFADIVMSKAIEVIFNNLSGAAHINSYLSIKDLDLLCHKFIQAGCTDKEKILITAIRNEARSNYYNAIDQYMTAKKHNRKPRKNKNAK